MESRILLSLGKLSTTELTSSACDNIVNIPFASKKILVALGFLGI